MENLVGFVKGSFFKVRRFQDEEDLEQQLGDWHREVNEERPLPGDGSRPCRAPGRGGASTASFEGAAGGAGPAYPGLRRPQGTVLRDGHAYSIPPEAISMPGTLYLYADRVRIVAGRHEAVHPRKFAPHEGSTLAAHRAALVAAVLGKRGKRYLKRQQMLDLGEPAFLYLTEIRPSPAAAVGGRGGSAARDSAEPRPGGSAARHGGGAQGGGLQRLLRGALPAALAFPGGEAARHHSVAGRGGVVGVT